MDVETLPDNSETAPVLEQQPDNGAGAVTTIPSLEEPVFISQNEAIGLYHTLMDSFELQYGAAENYPDWYGGGYLNNERPDHVGRLTLVLVESLDSAGLRREIVELLGSDAVDFVTGSYSLTTLRNLQDRVCALPAVKEVLVSCGVDEMKNRLDLELTQVSEEALSQLAKLDPGDDAIYVQIGRRAEVGSDTQKDFVVSHSTVPHEGGPEGDSDLDGNPAAYDPSFPVSRSEEAEKDSQTAHYDLLEKPRSADTPAYDPSAPR